MFKFARPGMIGKRPIRILETGISFTHNARNLSYSNTGHGKIRMLNYAERYIIFQMRSEIKVYDTTTNTLKSPYVSNQEVKHYIGNNEVDGSCCVAGMSIYCYVNPTKDLSEDGLDGKFNKLVRINAQKLV